MLHNFLQKAAKIRIIHNRFLTFEKMALECFGKPTAELFFVYTNSALFTPS